MRATNRLNHMVGSPVQVSDCKLESESRWVNPPILGRQSHSNDTHATVREGARAGRVETDGPPVLHMLGRLSDLEIEALDEVFLRRRKLVFHLLGYTFLVRRLLHFVKEFLKEGIRPLPASSHESGDWRVPEVRMGASTEASTEASKEDLKEGSGHGCPWHVRIQGLRAS